MGKRREGREAAVQFLFQHDLNPEEPKELLKHFWSLREASPHVREFCTQLVLGVAENRPAIDDRIRGAATNYELKRIAAVDRNILRVAIYEMLFCEDVPPVVAINEAIEIAKKYSADESGRFVNGVLDRIKLDIPRPGRTARPRPEI